MKKQDVKSLFSRRQFLGTSAAAAAVMGAGTLSTRCMSASGGSVSGSNFNGVQIGVITYSFRGLDAGIENVLQACIDCGVSDIELMSNGIEEYCGAPEVFRAPRRPRTDQAGGPGGMPGGMPGGFGGGQPQQTYTEEEYAEFERQAEESQAALSEWRATASMDKFAELGQRFRDGGVGIHIVKWSPANWSPEDIDYAYRATQAMGANCITNEIDADGTAGAAMGPIAEKYGMYAAFHSHMQYADPEFSPMPTLDASPACMLNFDAGHYFGSTGLNPVDFIREHQDRIYSIHLKDKTGPNTDPANQNQVWGQGEMPMAEVLTYIRDNELPIYCDIELEYPVAPWSNSVKEVKTCVNYARQILLYS